MYNNKYLEITSEGIVFDNVNVKDIAKQFGTPTYVYSSKTIADNYSILYNSFAKYAKDFKIHYAIKANTNINVLRLLKKLGSGADCSNMFEVELALKAGFNPKEILYTSNYTSKTDLQRAVKLGVTINLDDTSLLDAFNNVKPEIICFRLNPGIGYGKFKQIITAGPDAKFGIDEDKIINAYAKAKALGIKKFGLHMMTGSCVLKKEYFKQTTKKLFDIAGRISKTVGIKFEFINIGGGFGIPYTDKEKALDIDSTVKMIVTEFNKLLLQSNIGNPRLLLEPGRYIVGNSGILVSTVTAIKNSKFVGCDASMSTLLRPALYGAYHEILVANNPNGKKSKVNVCGQVCENTDIFAKDRMMPSAKIGDLLVFLNVGAYGFVMSSQYNNIPRPAEVFVYDGKIRLIRRREGFEDLIGKQVL